MSISLLFVYYRGLLSVGQGVRLGSHWGKTFGNTVLGWLLTNDGAVLLKTYNFNIKRESPVKSLNAKLFPPKMCK